jgi:cation transport ATPase
VLQEEKRIGVDALDAIVMVGCLGTMSIFAGAVCCWCLSFGRFLVRQSRDRSQKLLVDAFGKQPRFAWRWLDEAEVQVPTDQLEKGDIIVVHTSQEAPTKKLADSLGMDRHFAQVLPAEKADYVARLQGEGRKVCFVGDGINDSIALKKADVSISLRGASTVATDTAQVVFLEGGLTRLCELREIACNLDRNVNRSWSMIVAPNVTNMVGVLTMRFGIMTSVLTNNVSSLAALANGLLPLRKIGRTGNGRRSRKTQAPPSWRGT